MNGQGTDSEILPRFGCAANRTPRPDLSRRAGASERGSLQHVARRPKTDTKRSTSSGRSSLLRSAFTSVWLAFRSEMDSTFGQIAAPREECAVQPKLVYETPAFIL